jgi:hypothetical protein
MWAVRGGRRGIVQDFSDKLTLKATHATLIKKFKNLLSHRCESSKE